MGSIKEANSIRKKIIVKILVQPKKQVQWNLLLARYTNLPHNRFALFLHYHCFREGQLAIRLRIFTWTQFHHLPLSWAIFYRCECWWCTGNGFEWKSQVKTLWSKGALAGNKHWIYFQYCLLHIRFENWCFHSWHHKLWSWVFGLFDVWGRLADFLWSTK